MELAHSIPDHLNDAQWKKVIPLLFLFLFLFCSCDKTYPSVDEMLPPGTFNLSTVITDANGNSLYLAGDWAVFQDPDETKFTNYLHYDQTSETMFSVKENDAFMLEYDQGRESLPVYVNGIVDKRHSVFLQGATRDLIYKDGRIHTDYRDVYILYNAAYGDPDLHVIIDDNTLTFEDLPNVRLRRIKAFEKWRRNVFLDWLIICKFVHNPKHNYYDPDS